MSVPQWKNATIKSVSIDDCDRGMLGAWVVLDYGDSGGCQGFGGYVLYLPEDCDHHELKSYAGHFIWRCMVVGGVRRWEDLPGKTVRAVANQSKVHAIGHITKDIWFNPSEDFQEDK